MKLAYFCNYLNLHQVTLADELYNLLGNDFVFISTVPLRQEFSKGGEDYSLTREYCLRAFESDANKQKALWLAQESEACVFGAQTLEFELRRARTSKGFAIEGSERWLKRGWINIFSPRLLQWLWHYHTKFHKLPWYKIGSSAFTAIDDYKLHCYRGREYKWGYFTNVENSTVEAPKGVSTSGNATILWCARFLKWKHPELAVKLAVKLKQNGYNTHIDMYGDGPEWDVVRQQIDSENVGDMVTLHGNVPNAEVVKAMRSHDLFLFTSDKNEGWGAVANEAMSNRCCLVASDEIGSTPYLLKDGVNGMIFRSGSIDSLYEKVTYLLNHANERYMMAERGFEDMARLWNPKNAAKSLVTLIDDLMNGREVSITEGPCSKAELITL